MRFMKFFGIAIALAIFATVAGGYADAYQPAVNGCVDVNATYQFDRRPGQNWTVGGINLILRVDAGVQRLNNPLDQDGDQLVNLQRVADLTVGGDQTAEILIQIDPAQTNPGFAECGHDGHAGHDIVILNPTRTSVNYLDYLAIHEVGHLLGFEHGGARDGFLGAAENAQFPTRSSTCNSANENENYAGLAADDIGLLSWLHDPQAERQLMADSGFEFGYTSVWERPNTADFAIVDTAGARGDRRLRYRPSWYDINTSFLQQKIGLLTADSTPQFRATVAVGRRSSSADLDLRLRLYGRTIELGGNNNCTYDNAILEADDPNVTEWPQYTSSWMVRRAAIWVGLPTGWQTRSTTWWTAPSVEAIDLAVRIAGESEYSNGSDTYFWVDNLTVEQNT